MAWTKLLCNKKDKVVKETALTVNIKLMFNVQGEQQQFEHSRTL